MDLFSQYAPPVLRADVRQIPLRDACVDLIVTSPPYYSLRDYGPQTGEIGSESSWRDFLDNLIVSTSEMARVLKPSGSMFINLGDKYSGSGGHNNSNIGSPKERGRTHYARDSDIPPKSLMQLPHRFSIRCVDELHLLLRADIVWEKSNPMPESVQDRVRRAHEHWFHFTKQPSYYSNIDAVRQPYISKGYVGQKTHGVLTHTKNKALGYDKPIAQNPKGKTPISVRKVANPGLRLSQSTKKMFGISGHYAVFPIAWPDFFIRGWCPPGGVVLDPFAGAGTVAAAGCLANSGGINISSELEEPFCRLAAWRVTGDRQ